MNEECSRVKCVLQCSCGFGCNPCELLHKCRQVYSQTAFCGNKGKATRVELLHAHVTVPSILAAFDSTFGLIEEILN